jgi:hypothetical protein
MQFACLPWPSSSTPQHGFHRPRSRVDLRKEGAARLNQITSIAITLPRRVRQAGVPTCVYRHYRQIPADNQKQRLRCGWLVSVFIWLANL